MKITDRPGRYFALIFLAPFLLFTGLTIRSDYINLCFSLILISLLLFGYELFWISRTESEVTFI